MSDLLSFLPLLLRQRWRLVRAVVLALLTLGAGIALMAVSGWFLTAAALTTLGSAFNIFAPSAGVRGFSFLRILARYGERLAGHDATLRLLADIRRWLFSTLFPIVPLRDRALGRADLVSRLTADVDALDTAFLVVLGPALTAAAAGAALAAGLAVVLPAAALPFAGCYFAATLGVPLALVAASRRAGAGAVTAAAAYRAAVVDGLDGQADLIAFGALDRPRAAAASAAARLAGHRRVLGMLAAAASAAVQALAGLATLAILVPGLLALDTGTLDGPLLVGLLLAGLASFESAAPLVRGAGRLPAAAEAARRLRALSMTPPAAPAPALPAPAPRGTTLRFERVRFGWDGQSSVLADIDLKIAPGEHVAVVGPSGAGKSTLAALAARLVDPASGAVSIGGTDLRGIAPCDLVRLVAVMAQDAPVFHDTVRANLLLAAPQADDAALWAALAAARLDDVVTRFPQGLDTVLGEAGRTLSVGQARRLCLARTLLSPAPIVVLDEPTEGLDPEAAGAFLDELPGILAGRSLLLITHAMLPPGFGRVVRLAGGRLAA